MTLNVSFLKDLANTSKIYPNSTNNKTSLIDDFVIIGPTWSFMTAFFVITIILALLTNGSILLIFLFRTHLQTAFNIYLMNLLLANILLVIMEVIPDLLNQLYSHWWLGNAYCTVRLIGLYIFEAGVQNCHALIAINRIWAVFWPHSYRNRHDRRIAIVLCLAAWAEVLLWVLPGFMLDALYYRRNALKFGCRFNVEPQWIWSVIVQFTVYDIGPVLMWVAYPIIWFKRHQTTKVTPASKVTAGSRAGPSGKVKISLSKRGVSSGKTSSAATNDTEVVVKGGIVEEVEREVKVRSTERKVASTGFNILTALTISVTICWTPNHVIYTITMWKPVSVISEEMWAMGLILYSFQSLLDPIFFVLALPDLRETLKKVFRRSSEKT